MKANTTQRVFLTLVLVLTLAANASAEILPSFNMDVMSDRADRIVVGVVDQDGRLTINLLLKGDKADLAENLQLDESIAKQLRGAIGLKDNDTVEVAAFLDASDRPIWGSAGVVALEATRVWMCQETWGRGSLRHTENKDYTASSFVKKTRSALGIISHRKALSARPPSAVRADQIVDFLRGKDQYQLRQLVAAMATHDATEQDRFLQILKSDARSPKAGVILDLAGVMPFRPQSYDDVATFLHREHAPALRRKAISALPQINMAKVAVSFGPFLALDEPELRTFLTYLRASPGGSVENFPDAGVLAPMHRLVSEISEHHAEHGRQAMQDESSAVLGTVQNYPHPRFVPAVYDWALNGNHVTSNQALSTLQSLTSLRYDRAQRDSWHKWMEDSRTVLLADYDLTTDAGRTDWFVAWHSSDAATQRLLMRLWLFNANVPEEDLLKAASNTRVATTESAKRVLSELWLHERLSPRCRKQIVVKFLMLKRVQQTSRTKSYRHLRIAANPQFPFPEGAWVQPQCAWSLVATPPKLGNSYGAFSLKDVSKVVVGSWSGDTKDNSIVKTLVEIREVQRGSGDEVLWSHRWMFDAVPVGDVPYVREDGSSKNR